jgi:hypothetical protein
LSGLLEGRQNWFSIQGCTRVRPRFWPHGFQTESTGLAPRAIPTMRMMVDRRSGFGLSRCAAVTPLSRAIDETRCAELKRSERKELLCYLAPRVRRRSWFHNVVFVGVRERYLAFLEQLRNSAGAVARTLQRSSCSLTRLIPRRWQEFLPTICNRSFAISADGCWTDLNLRSWEMTDGPLFQLLKIWHFPKLRHCNFFFEPCFQ